MFTFSWVLLNTCPRRLARNDKCEREFSAVIVGNTYDANIGHIRMV